MKIKNKIGSDKLSFNKKGAVQQVFIYMMAIIVVGAIMLIGYKSISDIFNQKCDIDSITLIKDIEEKLDLNARYGSFEEIEIDVLCNYNEICFLNGDADLNEIYSGPADKLAYKAIRQAKQAGDQTNIYLIDGDFSEPVMYYEGLFVDNSGTGVTCMEAKGSKFIIIVEGISRGNVKVSDPEDNEGKAVDLS